MHNVTVCNLTYVIETPQADLAAALAAVGTRTFLVTTPNAEIAARARKDALLAEAICSSDLVLPDGDGVVLAARLAGKPRFVRRAGADFALALLDAANARNLRVYLLGGTEDAVTRAAAEIQKTYPSLLLCGKHNGFFNVYDSENDAVIQDIQRAKPDITLVCMGAPRQEVWMYKNRDRLPRGVYGGFGGVLDMLAGHTRRAPLAWQRLHLEWLYRTLKEPRRVVRLLPLVGYFLAARRSRRIEL